MDFPTDIAEFDKDPRISYSKSDEAWLLETGGREFLYNPILKRWVETIDEELIRLQQSGFQYKGEIKPDAPHPRDRKKRKNSADEANSSKPKKPRVNTAVWVTSVPLDATMEEIRDTFARYGVLAETLDSGEPRIKMYCDDDGKFKGEVLVVYLRPESVALAISMLDDTDFRLGISDPSGKIRVEEADSSYKREQSASAKLTRAEKKKIEELKARQEKKLAEWSDDEETHVLKKKPSESAKFVVLKHMFTLQALEDDPAALLEITEEIHSEASKIGDVTKVVLYDEEPEGVAQIRFVDPADAIRCVQFMNGRSFDRQRVVAYIWDGKEKFRKSRNKQAVGSDPEDIDDAEVKRLEKFGAWLEGREADNAEVKASHETNVSNAIMPNVEASASIKAKDTAEAKATASGNGRATSETKDSSDN